MRYLTIIASLTVCGLLTACTLNDSLLPDRRPDYKASRVESALEVPPDLTASTIDDTLAVPELNPTGSATLSTYAGERSSRAPTVASAASASEAVLRQPPGMRIERVGDKRWLVLNIPPEQAWPRIKEFWTSNGLLLTKEDPRIGIMETDWLENRADIPSGPIREVLKRVVDFAYSAPTRDKFRVRLERVGDETEVFLTHYGVQEVITNDLTSKAGRRDTSDIAIWQPRPRDPELEAEMLNRLMVYLGATEQRAGQQIAQTSASDRGVVSAPRVQLAQGPQGQKGLMIEEEYSRAWRLVGLALDDSSFVVENQNRANGMYLVEYRDRLDDGSEKGLLSRLAFWKDEPPPKGVRYQVRLAGRGPQTLVVIQNENGEPDNSATAETILTSIAEVIGGS